MKLFALVGIVVVLVALGVLVWMLLTDRTRQFADWITGADPEPLGGEYPNPEFRDPEAEGDERMESISGKLFELWTRHPEYRLTQLVVNVTGKTSPEVFYMPDATFETKLDEWLEKGPPQ